MKYEVILTPEAKKNFDNLDTASKRKLYNDYQTIESVDINCLNIKNLGNKLFEIKTDNLRSIFEYRKGQIIIVGLIFVKKTQKTPQKHLKLVKNILDKFEKE